MPGAAYPGLGRWPGAAHASLWAGGRDPDPHPDAGTGLTGAQAPLATHVLHPASLQLGPAHWEGAQMQASLHFTPARGPVTSRGSPLTPRWVGPGKGGPRSPAGLAAPDLIIH